MNGIKRFLNLIFAIAGLICVAVLALTWYGPWTRELSRMMGQNWFYMAVQVVLAITVLGLLVTLARGLFTPKPQTTFKVTQQGSTEVTITRDAVASLATKIVESDGSCVAEEISVRPKRGGVNIAVRVRPISTLDVLSKSSQLNDELYSGLAGLVGDKLKGVSLVFSEPETEHYIPAAQQAANSFGAGSYVPSYDAGSSYAATSETLSSEATQIQATPVDSPEQAAEEA